MFPYILLALDTAEDRVREIERANQRHRLVALANETRPPRRSMVRRPAAQLLAIVSRASAVVVRRLDACVADDLGRSLAPTE